MKSYRVTPELAGFDRKRTVVRVLFATGLFAVLQILFNVLWPSPTLSRYLLRDSIGAVISGIIFALLFVLVFTKRVLTYELVVSDDCITRLHPWPGFGRSVRKNEAKTVAETDGNILTAPALRISKHGRFRTWLWGSIWIPKALPEYQSIRDLAMNWKANV